MRTPRLIAGTCAAALTAVATLSASPASAAPEADCSIVDVTPSTIAFGLSDHTNVTFDVGTDCGEDAEVTWWLWFIWPDANSPWGGPMLSNVAQSTASRFTYIPGGKYSWPRSGDMRTGTMNVNISGHIGEGDDEAGLPGSVQHVTLVHRTTFGSTFNASPEPRRKGQKITVTGNLRYADWKADAYTGLGAYVTLQFRANGSDTWTDVKRVRSVRGVATTTVRANKSGTWRYQYAGNTTYGASNSKGDNVIVRPAR